jgi:hypothetical protein
MRATSAFLLSAVLLAALLFQAEARRGMESRWVLTVSLNRTNTGRPTTGGRGGGLESR